MYWAYYGFGYNHRHYLASSIPPPICGFDHDHMIIYHDVRRFYAFGQTPNFLCFYSEAIIDDQLAFDSFIAYSLHFKYFWFYVTVNSRPLSHTFLRPSCWPPCVPSRTKCCSHQWGGTSFFETMILTSLVSPSVCAIPGPWDCNFFRLGLNKRGINTEFSILLQRAPALNPL